MERGELRVIDDRCSHLDGARGVLQQRGAKCLSWCNIIPNQLPTSIFRSSSLSSPSFLTFLHLTYIFLQPVASLNANHLKFSVASSGASVSLSGSTFTSLSGGSVWTVSKTSGFYPANTYPTSSLLSPFPPFSFLPSPFSFPFSVSSQLPSSPSTIVAQCGPPPTIYFTLL